MVLQGVNYSIFSSLQPEPSSLVHLVFGSSTRGLHTTPSAQGDYDSTTPSTHGLRWGAGDGKKRPIHAVMGTTALFLLLVVLCMEDVLDMHTNPTIAAPLPVHYGAISGQATINALLKTRFAILSPSYQREPIDKGRTLKWVQSLCTMWCIVGMMIWGVLAGWVGQYVPELAGIVARPQGGMTPAIIVFIIGRQYDSSLQAIDGPT
ncbi:hypothetical protein AMATHDRAFT_45532 [Amanita thiersii Skay4041]|uniref:Uncharacterized protein n=1 Tax=Amanita thiersii Skay4041 TaxID=703135 RepID=A0A2A9NT23_9AGAR|nr:hypothetical protein AMATHDRAFT_45532 [Amanita thiersii Skay4041]